MIKALASIAREVLAGEMAAHHRRFAKAVGHLRRAVAIEASLKYSEPHDWPIPVRHNLGAVLLEAGRAREAETVYREDLERHGNNGWALAGLARSLEAQGRDEEAQKARQGLATVWARADVPVTESRF